MKLDKIYPETLKQLMLEILENSPRFSYLIGIQPFLMSFDGKEYYVYVKNLSSAYFKERPDTTRAQLPKRDDFEEIKKSSIPFIFLGYDQVNDVLVCWNFHIAKRRLNEKESVSFYSRQFFQEEVSLGTFLRKRLKNDDEPILFKRKDLINFFDRIDTFFPFVENDKTTTFGNPPELPLEVDFMDDKKLFVSNGKLLKITDRTLIEQLKPLVEQKRTLEAWQFVENFYKGKFPAMKLRDWRTLVKDIDFDESISETTQNIKSSENPYRSYSLDNVRNRFISYMQDTGLSEKTISNYTQALSGKISEGIRKYLKSDLEDIFKTTDILLLNKFLSKLFCNQEFIILDEIGKKMYSCALKKYIQFVEFLSSTETYIVAEQEPKYFSYHKQTKKLDSQKRKMYFLKVTYPNGRIVAERIVNKTLIDVIKNAGVNKVQELGVFINKVNLISDTIIPIYEKAQKPISNGLYVMTNCSTDKKKQIIEQISKAFNLGLKVEQIYISKK